MIYHRLAFEPVRVGYLHFLLPSPAHLLPNSSAPVFYSPSPNLHPISNPGPSNVMASPAGFHKRGASSLLDKRSTLKTPIVLTVLSNPKAGRRGHKPFFLLFSMPLL